MKKILAGLALAGSSLFAAPHVSIGVGIGVPAPAPVVAPAPDYVAPGYVDPQYVAPPPQVVVPPMPGPGYVWVDGYWYFNGGHRLWHAGFWRAPVRPEFAHGFDHGPVQVGHVDRGHAAAGRQDRGGRR